MVKESEEIDVIKILKDEGYIYPTKVLHDRLFRMDIYLGLTVKLKGKRATPYISIIRLKPKSFTKTHYFPSELLVPVEQVDVLIEALRKMKESLPKISKLAIELETKLKAKRILKQFPPEMKKMLKKLLEEEFTS